MFPISTGSLGFATFSIHGLGATLFGRESKAFGREMRPKRPKGTPGNEARGHPYGVSGHPVHPVPWGTHRGERGARSPRSFYPLRIPPATLFPLILRGLRRRSSPKRRIITRAIDPFRQIEGPFLGINQPGANGDQWWAKWNVLEWRAKNA